MDFFAHQDQARRYTLRLIVLFLLAVAAIVAAVYLAFALLAAGAGSQIDGLSAPPGLWQPQLFAPVGAGTLGLIGLGSLYKTAQLAAGGKAVAEMLGGELLSPQSADAAEHKLLNVVEEMAIAAGTPVPPVYLMRDEQGINAFAAGFSPQDAVIGVTRGTVDRLSRDELQGVIGHEFSHIVNGDMRLNLRLMGVLHGILLISLIGYWIMRFSSNTSSSRDSDRGRSGIGFVVFGLALYAIGYVGVFFGHLIKSAVSRQREFLADASAVQFTRNPDGIAGALRKIAALSAGSRIGHPQAEEASHLFFSNGLAPSLLNLLATHPPLAERIRRIDPSWDGTLPKLSRETAETEERGDAAPRVQRMPREAAAASAGLAESSGATPPVPFPAQATVPLRPAPTVARVGTTTDPNRAYASELLATLPPQFMELAHDPFDAAALVFALLVSDEPAAQAAQWGQLQQVAPPALLSVVERIRPAVAALPAEQRLPLAELALPALKRMSPRQIAGFTRALEQLARADRRISVFEFCLYRVVSQSLRAQGSLFGTAAAGAVLAAPQAALVLLSVLARAGSRSEGAAARAFAVGMAELDPGGRHPAILNPEQASLAQLDAALGALERLQPQWKKRMLAAATACVAADGFGTIEEVELVRAVAHSLDCPLPPLVVGALR